MIKTLLLMGTLNCSPAFLAWTTEEGLNKKDLDKVKHLRQRCGKGKLKDTPCLLYVRKKGELNYHVVCTVEKRK